MEVFTLCEREPRGEVGRGTLRCFHFEEPVCVTSNRRMWMAEETVGRAHGHAVDESV
jgi:hypothetical protein